MFQFLYIHVQLVSSCVLIFQVDIDSLIRCREIAAQILKDKTMLPTGYKFKAWPKNKHCNALTRSRSFKRKVEHVEIEDDVYDGIKRLYSEEVSAMSMTCASEFGQDKEISSPFVQPAVCANWKKTTDLMLIGLFFFITITSQESKCYSLTVYLILHMIC